MISKMRALQPGPERFDEAVSYIEKNRLYESALAIWKGTENYKVHSVIGHIFYKF